MNEITTEKLRYSDSSSSSPTLTIITPTYNRAHTLSACFNSLARQTCRDYQWIIVDDGSTDGTEELIESFAADGGVPFDYIRKRNGGKPQDTPASRTRHHGSHGSAPKRNTYRERYTG